MTIVYAWKRQSQIKVMLMKKKYEQNIRLQMKCEYLIDNERNGKKEMVKSDTG